MNLYEAVEVGASVQCPACGETFVVHDTLESDELASSFFDEAVPCDGCGQRYDVEWEAIRTVGASERWSSSVNSLTPSRDARMTAETSLPSSTTEDAADVEMLATRLMGWKRNDEFGFWVDQGGRPREWCREDFTLDTPTWDPYSDANADLQVLERVREVFPPKRMDRFASVLWMDLWGNRRIGHVWYRVGDYARAALAVLREMEEGS